MKLNRIWTQGRKLVQCDKKYFGDLEELKENVEELSFIECKENFVIFERNWWFPII